MKFPLLSLMISLPFFASLVCTLVRKENSKNAQRISLFVSLINTVFAIILWINFDAYNTQFQFVEQYDWLPQEGITFYLGIDGISLFFVLLSVGLSTLMIMGTWYSIKDRIREYSIACLFLQSFMIGSFSSLNLLLFYIFFEGILIPMFLIIGIWGGENRIYATIKFFLYTLFGSVFMLLAILKMYAETNSLNYLSLLNYHFPYYLQIILWLGFFASFAIKIPMWPLHTWLPDAHVEAPTGGSVILAGILLKMGGYGFLRICLPILPDASRFFAPYISYLSVIAIIWASLIALAQEDIKKLIAYSSIAHMGIVTFGLFSFESDALIGSILHMISHGLVSAGLFFCIGILYDRFHTRNKYLYSGLKTIMPSFSFIFLLFSLASIGLPLTSGFVGEILVLISNFYSKPFITGFACLGIVLSATYMLRLYRQVFLGKISTQLGLDIRLDIKDYIFILALKPLEKTVLITLSILIIVLGIYPAEVMAPIRRAVRHYYVHETEKIPFDFKKQSDTSYVQ